MTRLHLIPLAAVALSSALQAQTFTILLKDGDIPPGGAAVTAIEGVAVNSAGAWIVEIATANGRQLVKNGATFAKEGDPLTAPSGGLIGFFDDLTLNNLGTSGLYLPIDGTTMSTNSGIFVDTTLVILESSLSTAPQFSPGTPYIGWFGARWNDSRQLFLVASVDDSAITSTVDRALVRVQLDASNAIVSETVVSKEGDTIGGALVVDFGTDPYEFAFNNQGSAIWFAATNAATTIDGMVVVDNVVIAREGDPSPVSGRNYATLSSRPVDISDGGHTVFRADLDGVSTTDDEIIVRDGALFVQEGGGLLAITPFQFTAFGVNLEVDPAGRVFWFGDWNDPDTTRDRGIFVNDTLLVQIGVTQIGGLTVTSIPNLMDAFTISSDGRWFLFECVLTGNVDAAVLVDLGPSSTSFCFGDGTGTACPCANSGASGRGCANSTFASGTVLTSSGVAGASAGTDSLVLTATDVPGPGLFFQGDGQFAGGFGIAFGDGLLCAGGAIIRLGVVFPTGNSSSYPGGLTPNPIHIGGATASGDVRNYQCWYRDAFVFCTSNTFNLTQALSVTWGP